MLQPKPALPSLARRRAPLVVAVIVAVFGLRLAAQAAITPLGEGLDFYQHLAYILYVSENGRLPPLGEPTLPTWMDRAESVLPGPDHSPGGGLYRAWAALDPAEQAARRAAVNADTLTTAYARANYQGQHPPLYYTLLAGLDRVLTRGLPLDARVYWLTLASVALAALALPAVYKTFRLHLPEAPSLLLLLALAWYPNLLPFLGRLTNDTLAWPLLAWGLYFTLRARRSERPAHLAAGGALLLLACFAKAYALTLMPLYVLCALVGERRLTWRQLGLALPLAAVGVGALLAVNAATTGHLVPLTEVRDTGAQGWAAQARALLAVDLAWFLGGLLRGFWWVGYWSFVSPGVVVYLPLAALAYLLRPPRPPGRDWLELRRLWPHYAALALFTAGLLWHAALFTLRAQLAGRLRHPGNEGWYHNVLLGQVLVIGGVLLARRASPAGVQRALAGAVVVLMVWGALLTAVMGVYWGGAWSGPSGLFAVRWDGLVLALLDGRTWAAWWSLPGVLQPVALTALLPLALAVGGTAWVLRHPTVRRSQPAAEAARARALSGEGKGTKNSTPEIAS